MTARPRACFVGWGATHHAAKDDGWPMCGATGGRRCNGPTILGPKSEVTCRRCVNMLAKRQQERLDG